MRNLIMGLVAIFSFSCDCLGQDCEIGKINGSSLYVSDIVCNHYPQVINEDNQILYLHISSSHIGTLNLCHFPKLKGLFIWSKIGSIDCLDSLKDLKDIEFFSEDKNDISSFSNLISHIPVGIDYIGFNLYSRKSSINWIKPINPQSINIEYVKYNNRPDFKFLYALNRLNTIGLGNVYMDSTFFVYLQHLKIKSLSINKCTLSHSFWNNIDNIKFLEEFVVIGDDNVVYNLQSLRKITSLKAIELIGCNITEFPMILNDFNNVSYLHINTLNLSEEIGKKINFNQFDSIRFNRCLIKNLNNGGYWPNTRCKVYYNELRY